MKSPREVAQAIAKTIVGKLPLPIARPVPLRRALGAPSQFPLAKRRAVLLASDEDAGALEGALSHAGASVSRSREGSSWDIVVLVVPVSAWLDDLFGLHDKLHDAVSGLAKHGRLLIVSRSHAAVVNDALHALVRSLARELGSRGVTVNAVLCDDLGTVCPFAVFLASDRASFVSGQTLELDAGAHPQSRGDDPQIAVVTGASRGIGATIARTLVDAGYRLAVVDLASQQDAGIALRDALGGEGAGMAFYPCDISDPHAVEAMFERARSLSPRGKVDVLVNNAGITRDRTFRRMTSDEWSSVLAVNMAAVVEVTRRARHCMSRGGRIVNVASLTGLAGNFGQTNYAAAKGAVIGFTRQSLPELDERGIIMTAVAPGLIETEMTATIPLVNREVGKQMTSLAQMGQPDDVATVVEFLARPEALAFRRRVLRVDGGMFFGP